MSDLNSERIWFLVSYNYYSEFLPCVFSKFPPEFNMYHASVLHDNLGLSKPQGNLMLATMTMHGFR